MSILISEKHSSKQRCVKTAFICLTIRATFAKLTAIEIASKLDRNFMRKLTLTERFKLRSDNWIEMAIVYNETALLTRTIVALLT